MAEQPHITFPECPECNARQKAVGSWETLKWFCFNCHSTGTWEVHMDTTYSGAVTDVSPGDELPETPQAEGEVTGTA